MNSKSEYRNTIGYRIREARKSKGFTQEQVAKIAGLQRSSVAQWERNDSTPPIPTVAEVAKYLEVQPEYIAYGRTDDPVVVAPDPDVLGFALVSEVRFGTDPTKKIDVQKWGLPAQWLRAEIGITEWGSILVYKVEVAFTDLYLSGDRVIVDTAESARRPSPPGMFLYWDGVGPAIGHVAIIPQPVAKKLTARVKTPYGEFESDPDKLLIIGRIKGTMAKSS